MCMYSTMGKKKPYQKKSREVLDSTQKTYIGSCHLGFNIHPTSLTNQATRGRICCILTLGMDLTALPLFGTCLRSPATEHQIILPGCLHPLQGSMASKILSSQIPIKGVRMVPQHYFREMAVTCTDRLRLISQPTPSFTVLDAGFKLKIARSIRYDTSTSQGKSTFQFGVYSRPLFSNLLFRLIQRSKEITVSNIH